MGVEAVQDEALRHITTVIVGLVPTTHA